MKVRVLGSAAGGGFPQWNCNCKGCSGVRQGTLRATRRTQSSLAVSADGQDWLLFNASPDIHQQIAHFSPLQPAQGLRDSGIKGILLVDSQIDHTIGLFNLREGNPLEIYCTDPVYRHLTEELPILRVLQHYCGVHRHSIPLHKPFHALGLELEAVDIAGKAPLYSQDRDREGSGNTIGVLIRHAGQTIFYAPALEEASPKVMEAMAKADCLMVDGTFWEQEDMVRAGVGSKRAADMGHLPLNGPGGIIEILDEFPEVRRVLVHINNTNPILDEDSPEAKVLAEHGIEVAKDGWEWNT